MRTRLLQSFFIGVTFGLAGCGSADNSPVTGSGAKATGSSGSVQTPGSAGNRTSTSGNGNANDTGGAAATGNIGDAGTGNTGNVGPGVAGTGNGGSGIAGSGNAGAGNVGSGNAGSGNAGTGNAGTGNVGTGNAGSGNAGTGNAGTGNAGSGNAGTGNAGTGNAGTGNAGTGNVGAGTAGTGIAGSAGKGGVSAGGAGAAGKGGVSAGGAGAAGKGGTTAGGAAGSGATSGSGGSAGAAPTCPTTPLSGGTQHCSSNAQGTVGSYSYSIWSSGSGGCITPYGTGAAFKATWNNSGDFLAREGLQWNETQTYDQLGTISADYAYTKTGTAGGYSFIGIYGWSNTPLIEFYIVDDWYGSGPPTGGGALQGTFTVDGGTYKVYTHQQVNQPSIHGTQTFMQFFSVRQTARQCGHISVTEHFKYWASQGMTLGKMYEAKLLVEAGGGVGSIDYTLATMTAK